MALIIQGAAERAQGIHYEVDTTLPPLGVGGMGQVYRGYRVDERTGVRRDAAVKFLFEDLPESAVERSRREASVIIRNENLVEMFGFIEVDETDAAGVVHRRYHVASELLDGVGLYDLLHGKTTDAAGEEFAFATDMYRQYQNDRVAFAIRVTKNVLNGVMAMHDAGYVHRDIDPTNVMVTRAGKIKLIDFGIAKQMSAAGVPERQLTTAGQFMGKAAYAAPELVVGDVAHQNETTDIYAIGMMLFELLTGHQAYEGAVHEVLDKQLRGKMPLGEIANKDLRRIVEIATAKRQQDRFASAAEFRVALEQLSRTTTSGGERLINAKQGAAGKGANRNVLYAAAAAVGVLVVAAGAFFALRGGDDKPTAAEPIPTTVVEQPAEQATEAPAQPTPEQQVSAAVDLLATDAATGVKQLTDLANGGNARAMYELSLLYGRSVTLDATVLDAIDAVVPRDAKKAHELNERAVAADAGCYQALYELGCDYMAGDQRGAVERDIDKARNYFKTGADKAAEAHDEVFIEKFRMRINALEGE